MLWAWYGCPGCQWSLCGLLVLWRLVLVTTVTFLTVLLVETIPASMSCQISNEISNVWNFSLLPIEPTLTVSNGGWGMKLLLCDMKCFMERVYNNVVILLPSGYLFLWVTSNWNCFCSCVHIHKPKHISAASLASVSVLYSTDSNTKASSRLSRVFFSSEQSTYTFLLVPEHAPTVVTIPLLLVLTTCPVPIPWILRWRHDHFLCAM